MANGRVAVRARHAHGSFQTHPRVLLGPTGSSEGRPGARQTSALRRAGWLLPRGRCAGALRRPVHQ
eukprot:2258082-Alexandrium_andersonii.AAC.1